MKNCITIYILLWIVRELLSYSDESEERIYTYDSNSVSLGRCDDKSYRCHDGSCIAEQYYCNGMIDCIGGEDEDKCETCPLDFCSCPDGLCARDIRGCDSVLDCSQANKDETVCNGNTHAIWNVYNPQKRCIVEQAFSSDDGSAFSKFNCSNMDLVAVPCISAFSWVDVLILNNNKLGLFNGLSQPLFGSNSYEFLRILELDKNSIKDLPTTVIKEMMNLEELSLADNQIRYLDNKRFPRTLAKLEKLNLTRNSITTIASNAFAFLVNLKSLDLSYNQIEIIANQTFHHIKELTELYLNSNKITKLEQNIFSTLQNLNVLFLQRNRISIIENNDAFISLRNLTILDISHNNLTQLVPETFQNLTSIKTLILSNNNIVKIYDETFTNLLQLDILCIDKNRITKIPYVFPHDYLDASENEIEVIANHSFSDRVVFDLRLNHNNLNTIKSEMFRNAQINNVNLSNNHISVIERHAFSGMKPMMPQFFFILSINFNDLTKLTSEMFQGLIDVEKLFLKNNKISAIEDNVFQSFNTLHTLDLSFNALREITSTMFQGLEKLRYLWLGYNEIKTIESNSFKGIEKLFLLDLSNNRLTQIRSDTFENVREMRFVYLQNNELEKIESNALHDMSFSWGELDLSNNSLTEIPQNVLKDSVTLKVLYLQMNKIENIKSDSFDNLKHLVKLNLSNNQLSTIHSNTFQHVIQLRNLYLQQNKIEKIEMNVFNCSSLTTLDLSDNMLHELESYIFSGLPALRILHMQRNRIRKIEEGVFKNLTDLKMLNLKNNIIGQIQPNILKGIRRLQRLIVDEYRFCCLINNARKCESPKDAFSSCEDLMKNTLLRISVWLLGVIAIFANSFVIIFRIRYHSANTNKINSFLIKCLAMSDLFMGVYLLIIASMDTIYRGEYYLHDFNWRQSFWCNMAGFLSTFSSELTVFILTVLSIDRLYAVKFPFRAKQRAIKRIKKLMTIVWVVAAIIALIPLPFVNIHYFKHFYGRSGVCLPLHITTDTPNGWQYSVFVFIFLNAMSFTIITINYVRIYRTTTQTRRSISSSNQTTGSMMAYRMTLLVLADAACWIPIIVLGIRSLMGITLSPSVYPWIAVFVLPLNAALNPLLYTISSIPMVIKVKFPNTRLNGRLIFKFSWPCHWVAANEPRKSNTITMRLSKMHSTRC